jgi:hypothetical protein
VLPGRTIRVCAAIAATLVAVAPVLAVVVPEPNALSDRAVRHPQLTIGAAPMPASELPGRIDPAVLVARPPTPPSSTGAPGGTPRSSPCCRSSPVTGSATT